MSALGTTRLIVHIIVLILSVIALGLSAHVAWEFSWAFGATLDYTFAKFALAVSVITVIILVPVLIIECIRKNAFCTWTAVDIIWNGLLCIFWLAVGANTANIFGSLDCSLLVAFGYFDQSTCQQIQGLEGIPFLIFFLLLGLVIYLLVVGIMQHSSGNHSIWTTSAADAGFRTGGTYPMASTNAAQGGTVSNKPAQAGYPAEQTSPAPGTGGYPGPIAEV